MPTHWLGHRVAPHPTHFCRNPESDEQVKRNGPLSMGSFQVCRFRIQSHVTPDPEVETTDICEVSDGANSHDRQRVDQFTGMRRVDETGEQEMLSLELDILDS